VRSASAPAPALLSAIRAVSERDDADSRRGLYSSLLGSTLLMPAEPGTGDAAATDGLRLFTTPPDEDGSWKLLAFSDPDAASAWRSDGVKFVAVSASEVFALAVGSATSAILLNVAGPAGGELTRREFAALAEGTVPAAAGDDLEELELGAGAEVLVTAPAKPPGEAFLGVLRMAVSECAPVRAAWLADVAFEAGELHPAVGVALGAGTDEDELREVFDHVMMRVQPLLGHGRYLDFIVVDDVWGPLFADAGPPIFERDDA
jgi:hypothetical protein